jgi:hypothetical protein
MYNPSITYYTKEKGSRPPGRWVVKEMEKDRKRLLLLLLLLHVYSESPFPHLS